MGELPHDSDSDSTTWGNSDDAALLDPREFVEQFLSATETCDWCLGPLFREHETPAGTVRDPAPEAGRAYFPPTEIDGRRKSGGKRTYCEACGRTDSPAPNENRTKSERHQHLDHVLEHLPSDVEIDTDAAHDTVSRLNRRDDLADLDVLAAAVDVALPDVSE